jgi:hypothetical protein
LSDVGRVCGGGSIVRSMCQKTGRAQVGGGGPRKRVIGIWVCESSGRSTILSRGENRSPEKVTGGGRCQRGAGGRKSESEGVDG